MVDAEQLNQLCELAERAGAEIMGVYATAFTSRPKEDLSPVTEADLRADRVIREGLSRLFPGIPIVSEESLPATLPSADEPYFLVDPLDGTKEFVARTGEFTVNIALVHRGKVLAGVVLAPASSELFYAATGVGAFRRNAQGVQAIRVGSCVPQRPLRILCSRTHGADRLAAWMAALPPHTFSRVGSSLKFCRLAEGAADLYVRLGATCQWDTAAGQCVLEQAGGQVLDLTGRPLRYEPRPGWLNPEFVACSDAAYMAYCAPLAAGSGA